MKIYGNLKKLYGNKSSIEDTQAPFELKSAEKSKIETQDKSLSQWAYLSVLEQHRSIKRRGD